MLSIGSIESAAAALYDGGWRAEDHEELIQEYGWTSEEADALCALLEDFDGVRT